MEKCALRSEYTKVEMKAEKKKKKTDCKLRTIA